MKNTAPALTIALLLAACGRQAQVEQAGLDAAGENAAALELSSSPDVDGARWAVAADGKGVDFGKPNAAPYLTLHCTISSKAEPRLSVIRHALSEPGAKALFPVIGNGTISRLKLDATLADGGWRWEGTYPASAPELDVFTGRRDIEATLPGAGTLRIAGSPLPGQFIGWCRRNGKEPAKEQDPADGELSSPEPAREGLKG